MKTSKLFVIVLLILTLLALGQVASARALFVPERQGGTDLAFNRMFLAGPIPPFRTWGPSSVKVDGDGGVHAVFYDNEHINYAYCAEACTEESNWNSIPIGANDADGAAYAALELTSEGRPRIIYYNENPYYYYRECDDNCLVAAAWGVREIKPTTDFESPNNWPKNVRYFALDSQDRPRFVADLSGGLTYVYCDEACTEANKWTFRNLALGNTISRLQLVFTSNDQPRVLGIDNTGSLRYAQCDANCEQSASWSHVKLTDTFFFTSPSYALRLDAQDRPRIAFYNPSPSDNNLYYAWADSDFTNAESWKIDNFAAAEWPEVAPAPDRILDLAIDSQGRPHIVFADKNFDLRYLKCTSQCNTLTSSWSIQTIETSAELDESDYLPPLEVDGTSAWSIRGFPSLALDAQDRPVVTYYAENRDTFDGDTVIKTRAIRVAVSMQTTLFQLYLPLISR